MLPTGLVVSGAYGWVTIQRSPRDLAQRLMKLATGREVVFGGFSSKLKGRKDLGLILASHLPYIQPVLTGMKRSDNPAAYLSTALESALDGIDRKYAEAEERKRLAVEAEEVEEWA